MQQFHITLTFQAMDSSQLDGLESNILEVLNDHGLQKVEVCLSPGKSILKPWVQSLGLRHQGVLVSAVRGCDTAPKLDASKALTRCYREVILQSHCGDSAKARTFIERVDHNELFHRFQEFRKNCDHYPIHYVLHFIHAAEIIGYYHPASEIREDWSWFYYKMCNSMHLNIETKVQLEERLNASEEVFATKDRLCEKDCNPTEPKLS